MKIESFTIVDVNETGKVKKGGAVETKGLIRMSAGDGCGLDGCNCSNGYWISICQPRTLLGEVSGVTVHFDDKEEFELFMATHETIMK